MKKCIAFCLILFGSLLFSCNEEYTIIEEASTIQITTEQNSKLIGSTFIFTVKNDLGVDVTQDAELRVNGQLLGNNTFQSSIVGNYDVEASYFGVKATMVISYFDGTEVNFAKRVLIEDFTGTWCGFCPRVSHAMSLVSNQTDKSVQVAIHRASSNPTSNNYDPFNFDASELEAMINIPGYPKATLNRTIQWNFPEPNNINQAIALTQGNNPKMGLAIKSILTDNQLSLEIKVKFSGNFNDLKLVVYVLENGLIYEQYNYTNYYGAIHPLVNYVHNNVLRACLTPILGESIPSNQTVPANIYTKNFNINLPITITNSQNVEFVAFVVDSNNKAVNAREATINTEQTFEEL